MSSRSNSNSFESISPKLLPQVLNAIKSFGFHTATPVQAATIPLFVTNKDVCVEATTGSGKTLAFAIPIFEILIRKSMKGDSFGLYDVGALVIAPTRELATQIHSVISKFIPFCSSGSNSNSISDNSNSTGVTDKSNPILKVALFLGGTNIDDSMSEYTTNGGQIIISTPGRLIDIHNRYGQYTKGIGATGIRCFNLKTLEVLILDEADVLLDMGFKITINEILKLLPKMRRTGLFSATQTKEVREIARAGMRNPVTVTVKVQMNKTIKMDKKTTVDSTTAPGVVSAIPSTLSNFYQMVEYDAKPTALVNFMQEHPSQKILIFCATCACVEYYSSVFHEIVKHQQTPGVETPDEQKMPENTRIYGFHGKMVPVKRNAIYQKFVDLTNSTAVLFCTDVAARGIDIPDVDWIIQWTPPKDPAFYIHRIGRTARAGRNGGAILYLSESEASYVELLKSRNVKLNEYKYTIPTETDNTDKMGQIFSINNAMKDVARTDRKILELSSTAFMAFIKAYQEHICSFIFRLDELNMGGVGRSYGLLKLPKIPETCGRNRKKIDFQDDDQGKHTSLIPYKNISQEAARQRRLIEAAQVKEEELLNPTNGDHTNNKNKPKSIPVQKQFDLDSKHKDEKRARKQKKSKHQAILDEWDELAAEETMYKKNKKGKMKNYDDLYVFNEDNHTNSATIDDIVKMSTHDKKRKFEYSDSDSD